MLADTIPFQILCLLLLAILVHPVRKILSTIFKMLGELLKGLASIALKLIQEILSFLVLLLTKIFELLAQFLKWLFSLF